MEFVFLLLISFIVSQRVSKSWLGSLWKGNFNRAVVANVE